MPESFSLALPAAPPHHLRSTQPSPAAPRSVLPWVLLLGLATGPQVLAQQTTAPYQSQRLSEDSLAISREALSREAQEGAADLALPETRHRGSDATEAPERSRDQQHWQLYSELAAEYALIDRVSNLVKRVAQVVKPSVIHIEARKVERSRGRTEAFDEAGAGVVVSIAGQPWVLTNRHVILGAEPAEILIRTSDGQQLRPTRVFADASTDVAVMQVDVPLPPARVGDRQSVEVGDFVLAIGSPFGLSHSVTFGILSATGRRDLTLGSERIELQDFFQTDAAINPGNSGGPLLNLRGEVIAINTAIASNSGGSEGIGFAIPIDMAMRVAEELVQHGSLRRGYLGVTLDPDFQAAQSLRTTGQPYGARIKEVRPGSPAEQARLQRGDVILEFDGMRIENDDHLVTRVGLTALSQEVPVVIFRDGERYRASLSVAPMP